MKSFEKELELIEGFMSLYPNFSKIDQINYCETKEYKQPNNLKQYYFASWWIYYFCKYQINMRLPQIEEFLKHCNKHNNISSFAWYRYNLYFGIE